jgi:hypothetical protein
MRRTSSRTAYEAIHSAPPATSGAMSQRGTKGGHDRERHARPKDAHGEPVDAENATCDGFEFVVGCDDRGAFGFCRPQPTFRRAFAGSIGPGFAASAAQETTLDVVLVYGRYRKIMGRNQRSTYSSE